MSYRPVGQPNVGLERKLESVKTAEATAKLSFLERAQLASGDAWSPDPKNPPLYLDLPKKVAQPAILAKWAPNGPLDFIDQYIPSFADTTRSRSTLETRTTCSQIRPSCTTCSIGTASPIRLKFTQARIPALWRTVSKIK